MELQIKVVTSALLDDVGRLFSSDAVTEECRCMWFIIPVKQFHAVGSDGNRAGFSKLAAESDLPLGLLAYQNDQPVGWCAAGPRSRYARALKTPTYKGQETNSESNIWLVPCFFIHKNARGVGISQALLEDAVKLAEANGASAIDGFPYTGAKSRASGDMQVGYEALFSSCGFVPIRRPSTNRVVMRREFKSLNQ